jgi:hypothetical protein
MFKTRHWLGSSDELSEVYNSEDKQKISEEIFWKKKTNATDEYSRKLW